MLDFLYMELGTVGVYICLFFALYFEVFLLISFLEKRPAKKTSKRPTYYPSVSMVVPCFNEGNTLAGTITSLLNMEYPKEKLEILVIDDGSKDNTREIGEEYAKRFPAQVKYFHKKNGGKFTALNFAIEKSTSEFIGCLDADSFVEPDALIEVMKRFEEDKETMAIVPVMKVHNPKTPLEVMQVAEYTFGIFVKKIFDNLGAISVLPGPFSIYRREVFKIVGPFHRAHNTEDMEIAFRIQKHGLKIVNAHTAFVYTTVPKTVRSLVTQRVRWTQGFLQNSKDYWFMFGNPKFGNFGLFALPFSISMFFGALYMTCFLVYQFFYTITTSVTRISTTGIFPTIAFEMPTLDWFFINTSMLNFLVVAVLGMTLASILIGRNIAKDNFGIVTVVSYVMVYGFLAPLWLVRALWGTLLARESTWR
jgi:cellulose synthase/poly-beta-1,6-N-acetylglucosamine synthase-like glycosyltransferase